MQRCVIPSYQSTGEEQTCASSTPRGHHRLVLFFPPSSRSSNTLVTEAPQVSSLQEHMGGARGAKESNPKQMGRRWRRTQYVCGCVRGKRRRQCVERLTPPPPLHTCQSRWRHWQLIPEPGGLAGGLLFNSVEGFCFFFIYFFIFEGVGVLNDSVLSYFLFFLTIWRLRFAGASSQRRDSIFHQNLLLRTLKDSIIVAPASVRAQSWQTSRPKLPQRPASLTPRTPTVGTASEGCLEAYPPGWTFHLSEASQLCWWSLKLYVTN